MVTNNIICLKEFQSFLGFASWKVTKPPQLIYEDQKIGPDLEIADLLVFIINQQLRLVLIVNQIPKFPVVITIAVTWKDKCHIFNAFDDFGIFYIILRDGRKRSIHLVNSVRLG